MRFVTRRDKTAALPPEDDAAALVTYSRLSPRDPGPARAKARPQDDRVEPYILAEEVPYVRAARRDEPANSNVPIDDLVDAPRPRRRRTGRWVVLVGLIALGAGVSILAYAYGVATRLDTPSQFSSATASGPAEDGVAAREVPLSNDPSAVARQPEESTGETTASLPPAEGAAPGAPPAVEAVPPKPVARPGTASAPAAVPVEPAKAGPAPAIKAPVPATIAPSGTPAGDGLIANIERILQRDGATEGAPDQSGVGLAVPADPALAGSAPLPLPPSAGSGGIVIVDPTLPPADVGGPPPRLLPPANIPLPPAGPIQ